MDSLNRWKCSADDFARRIEASDLRGTLQRGLVVEPGTHAVIFQGGTLAATVAEGTYNLTRPMQGVDLAVPATAIVMDAGETRIPLLYRDLRTREEVPADVIVEVVVRLGDTAALDTNLMHGRPCLSIAGLASLVWSAGAGVVQARVTQTAARDLAGSLELKNLLESDLQQHVGQTLARNGLELVELRFVSLPLRSTIDLGAPSRDCIGRRKDCRHRAPGRTEPAAAASPYRRSHGQVHLGQRLGAVHPPDRTRDGMKEVIRQAEMESLKRDFDEKQEDREIARRHLLERLDLEHDLAVIQLKHRLSNEELEACTEAAARATGG